MSAFNWPPRSADGLHGATFNWDLLHGRTEVRCICGFYRSTTDLATAESEYTNHVQSFNKQAARSCDFYGHRYVGISVCVYCGADNPGEEEV